MVTVSRFLPLCVLLAGLLGACAEYPPVPASHAQPDSVPGATVTAQQLQGSEWTVSYIDGVGASQGNWPRLRWTEGDRVSGSGGCNAFAGSATMGTGSMRFEKLAAIGKLCVTEPGGQEDRFFRALELTRKAQFSGSRLLLLDESGNTLLRLERIN